MKKSKPAKSRAKKSDSVAASILISVVKGTVAAMVFTILAILVFAFAIKAISLEDTAIAPVNQAIKIIGIIFAAFVATKGNINLKWLRGCLAGIVYVVVGFILFSLIEGTMGLLPVLISDALAGGVIGLAAALLAAALPGKTKKA